MPLRPRACSNYVRSVCVLPAYSEFRQSPPASGNKRLFNRNLVRRALCRKRQGMNYRAVIAPAAGFVRGVEARHKLRTGTE